MQNEIWHTVITCVLHRHASRHVLYASSSFACNICSQERKKRTSPNPRRENTF
jgi:hypothetical protein